MIVLVTGVSGLLGLNFSLRMAAQQPDGMRLVGIYHQNRLQNIPFELIQADLTDGNQVEEILDETKPDLIVNCAAMANIDHCEANPERAGRINADMPGWLAKWTSRNGARLVHISTDAVFDGTCGEYRETDLPNPLSRYALTKLEGEQRVLSENPNALIARVNFYGCSISGTRSLAEWFYGNLLAGKAVMGFTDVFFCPLFVDDLSDILWKMAQKQLSGLFHVVSSECLSKYEFGVLLARKFRLDEKLVMPSSWKDAGLLAVRSPNLRLMTEKVEAVLGEGMPAQPAGLEGFVRQIQAGFPAVIKNFTGHINNVHINDAHINDAHINDAHINDVHINDVHIDNG